MTIKYFIRKIKTYNFYKLLKKVIRISKEFLEMFNKVLSYF